MVQKKYYTKWKRKDIAMFTNGLIWDGHHQKLNIYILYHQSVKWACQALAKWFITNFHTAWLPICSMGKTCLFTYYGEEKYEKEKFVWVTWWKILSLDTQGQYIGCLFRMRISHPALPSNGRKQIAKANCTCPILQASLACKKAYTF